MTVLLLYNWNHNYNTLFVKGWAAEDYQRHTNNKYRGGKLLNFFYPMRIIEVHHSTKRKKADRNLILQHLLAET